MKPNQINVKVGQHVYGGCTQKASVLDICVIYFRCVYHTSCDCIITVNKSCFYEQTTWPGSRPWDVVSNTRVYPGNAEVGNANVYPEHREYFWKIRGPLTSYSDKTFYIDLEINSSVVTICMFALILFVWNFKHIYLLKIKSLQYWEITNTLRAKTYSACPSDSFFILSLRWNL